MSDLVVETFCGSPLVSADIRTVVGRASSLKCLSAIFADMSLGSVWNFSVLFMPFPSCWTFMPKSSQGTNLFQMGKLLWPAKAGTVKGSMFFSRDALQVARMVVERVFIFVVNEESLRKFFIPESLPYSHMKALGLFSFITA